MTNTNIEQIISQGIINNEKTHNPLLKSIAAFCIGTVFYSSLILPVILSGCKNGDSQAEKKNKISINSMTYDLFLKYVKYPILTIELDEFNVDVEKYLKDEGKEDIPISAAYNTLLALMRLQIHDSSSKKEMIKDKKQFIAPDFNWDGTILEKHDYRMGQPGFKVPEGEFGITCNKEGVIINIDFIRYL